MNVAVVQFKLMKFYKVSNLYEFATQKRTEFTSTVIKTFISDVCQTAKAIAIETKGSDIEVKNTAIGRKMFDVNEWMEKESVGYNRNDRLPDYRIVRGFPVTTPLYKLEMFVLGKNKDQSVLMKSKKSRLQKILYVYEILELFDQLKKELNDFVAMVATNVGATGIALPEIEMNEAFEKLLSGEEDAKT